MIRKHTMSSQNLLTMFLGGEMCIFLFCFMSLENNKCKGLMSPSRISVIMIYSIGHSLIKLKIVFADIIL